MPFKLLDDILAAAQIGENSDWEFKSAKGGLPRSFWESYSGMANTTGGVVVLGVSERDGAASLDGLSVERLNGLEKALWDNLNNRSTVSRNLLTAADVQRVRVEKGWLVVVRIPPASRTQRPVYLGPTPFGHTYRRLHEGDYRCTDEEIRRMLADADDRPADARILDGFDLDDLDAPSLAAFRNRFAAVRPAHPWLDLDAQPLLEQLGGWRRDREAGCQGLTLAGLLMFGKHQAIIAPGAVPRFMVDFRDYRDRTSETDRWSDRLYPDGTWEANLFQFFQRLWPKLTEGLRVPFALEAGQRVDETPIHQALREAVVNALIHADYSAPGGVVIERHRERYQIENPGTLLVSVEQLKRGGVSECRNKSLQRMFDFMGLGEQAGSGFARIQSGWKSQAWRAPSLTTQFQPDRVRLTLPMLSLIPEDALSVLKDRFAEQLDALTGDEVLALATAVIEQEMTNARMQELLSLHPSDITKLLQGLVTRGFLSATDQRRWTRYRLLEDNVNTGDLFSAPKRRDHELTSPHLQSSSPHLGQSSPQFDCNSPHSAVEAPAKNEAMEELRHIARSIAEKGRVSEQAMRDVILQLCRGRHLTLAQLSSLLHRNAPKLRDRHLTPLVRANLLKTRYPAAPNHPDQAYETNSPPNDG